MLVIGGAGFIGGYVVREARARGHAVRVLDKNARGDAYACDIVAGAIFLDASIEWADVVVNLAGVLTESDTEGCMSVNVMGTLSVARASAARDKKLIYSSSAGIYGERRGRAHEALPPSPQNIYALSKLGGEFCVKHECEDATILRFFNVYGAGSRPPAVVPCFMRAAARRTAPVLNGDGRQVRDFIHAADVARAVVLAAESDSSGTFNVGSGRGTSMLVLYDMICEVCGSEPSAPVFTGARGGVALSVADTRHAERVLGFKAQIPLEEGLKMTRGIYAAI
jgi:UDP-glucose 4-epimerase